MRILKTWTLYFQIIYLKKQNFHNHLESPEPSNWELRIQVPQAGKGQKVQIKMRKIPLTSLKSTTIDIMFHVLYNLKNKL